MRHLAAYLLLVVGGNATPSAEDVSNVLSQAGVEVDEERLNQLVAELEGKDIAELIALGQDKLYVGGMAAGAAAPAAGTIMFLFKLLILFFVSLNAILCYCLC